MVVFLFFVCGRRFTWLSGRGLRLYCSSRRSVGGDFFVVISRSVEIDFKDSYVSMITFCSTWGGFSRDLEMVGFGVVVWGLWGDFVGSRVVELVGCR